MSDTFSQCLLDKTNATIKRGLVTRQEMVTICSRINSRKHAHHQIIIPDEGISLSDCHIAQGIMWLKDQWKGKSGKERKNCPFGDREKEILSNFDTISVEGFYNGGRFMPYYQPIYTVLGGPLATLTFDYILEAGRCKVVG